MIDENVFNQTYDYLQASLAESRAERDALAARQKKDGIDEIRDLFDRDQLGKLSKEALIGYVDDLLAWLDESEAKLQTIRDYIEPIIAAADGSHNAAGAYAYRPILAILNGATKDEAERVL